MNKFKYLIFFLIVFFSNQVFAEVIFSPNDIKSFDILPNFQLLLLGGISVMMMQAGFAIIEGGYEKKYKSMYGLFINYLSAVIGSALFVLVSYFIYDFGFINNEKPVASYTFQGWHWNLIFFYTLMATTLTTIVGRIIPSSSSLRTFWFIGLVNAALIFPTYSSWVWGNLVFGGGWLKKIGFIDFAGSTVVHSIAAWVVLAGYLVLKPFQKEQLKKRDIIFDDYKVLSIALAGFVLWLAWSGLNVIYITDIPVSITNVVVNTIIALVGAVMSCLICSLIFLKKSTWEALIKAAVGGLVAITASCGFIDIYAAILIGMISGFITLFAPLLLAKWIFLKHIREVITIHGICGVWGTLAVSFTTYNVSELTGYATFGDQLIGVIVAFVWSFGLAYLMFKSIYYVKDNKLISS